MPPLAEARKEPLLLPAQRIVCVVVIVAAILEGWLMLALAVTKQLLASLTVTLYVPAAKPVAVWAVALFDQWYK